MTSLKTIVEICAQEYGVTTGELIARNRKRNIVDARNTAFLIMKQKLGGINTLTEIGNALGARHHTTVISQVKQAENLLLDDNFRYKYESIISKL